MNIESTKTQAPPTAPYVLIKEGETKIARIKDKTDGIVIIKFLNLASITACNI